MSYTALIRIAFVFPLMRSLFRFLGGRGARQLVGPPHPISHIRPILYDTASRPPTDQTHPYSLSEFTDGTEDSLELQLRIEQQRLYLFNHEFWLDVSTTSSPLPFNLMQPLHLEQHAILARKRRDVEAMAITR